MYVSVDRWGWYGRSCPTTLTLIDYVSAVIVCHCDCQCHVIVTDIVMKWCFLVLDTCCSSLLEKA